MFGKTAMLGLIVLLAIGFAVPASASADLWADGGIAIEEGVEIEQSYEGFVQFNAGAAGTFGCDVTMTVVTEGPSAGRITKFNPTAATCKGTVAFAGCTLTSHKVNVEFWRIAIGVTPFVVSASGKNLTTHATYKSCAGGQTTTHLEYTSFRLAVEGTNPITKLTVSGTATNGVLTSGSLTPEGTATLGVL